MSKSSDLGSRNKNSSEELGFFPPTNVMVGIDGSDNAERALQVSIALSKAFAAKLFIITVTPRDRIDLGSGFPGSTSSVQKYNEEMDRRSENLLERSLDAARKAGLSNVEIEAIPEFQSVPKQLLELAQSKKIGLIILGTRGLGGFKRLVLGSVSSAVVGHAECNVMIIR